MQKAFADWEKLYYFIFRCESPLPFCVIWAIASCKLIWEMAAVVTEKYFCCLGSTDEHTQTRRKVICLGDFSNLDLMVTVLLNV